MNLFSVFQHCNQSDHVTKLSDTLNIIFTVLFTLEMVVKLIAFKAKVKMAAFDSQVTKPNSQQK